MSRAFYILFKVFNIVIKEPKIVNKIIYVTQKQKFRDTDKQAKARYDILMKQMLEKNPIEKLYLY